MDLLIRKYGSLIDIGEGYGPLPAEIVDILSRDLTYIYRRLRRGEEAYNYATERREPVSFEPRLLYTIENGRLTTGYGLTPRILRLLAQHGHRAYVLDISPPRTRANAYQTDWEAVRNTVSFRPRQLECLEAIANNPGGIIKAPPGFGKTWLLYALAVLYPHAKIDIVIKSKDVAARIVRQLSRYLPLVGMVGGGRRQTGRVTVYTIDSLHHADGDADFLCVDEAHQAVAPRAAEMIGRLYRFSRNYGFTATPTGRFDGADARLEMFFGPIIFSMSYEEAVSLGLVVPIMVRWLTCRMQSNPVRDLTQDTARKRHGIWRNFERNRLIAEDARANYQDHQVLILVETVEHAIYLWQHLPEYQLCYAGVDAARVERYRRWGLLPDDFVPMNPKRREEMRRGFEAGTIRKVIATDVWATGVDFDQLQVVYSVSGRQSEIWDQQGPGRVSRVHESKEYGEVVDIVDTFDRGMLARSRARYRHYKALGWSQDWPDGRRQIAHVHQ